MCDRKILESGPDINVHIGWAGPCNKLRNRLLLTVPDAQNYMEAAQWSTVFISTHSLAYYKILKNGVLWDVTPCGSCKNRRFGGT
jgi:hypothetical protein